MTLADLFSILPLASIKGNATISVRGISVDSREVRSGDLFVALTGEQTKGSLFIDEAINKGAVAIAGEELPTHLSIPTIAVSQVRENLGRLAARLYEEPSQRLRMVGITGTNGKTTVALLTEAMLRFQGIDVGYIGTLFYRWKDQERPAFHTSPEAPIMHSMLRAMVDADVTDAVVECSSHGLALGRTGGLDLDVGVFTNLTSEHLDFHRTIEHYRAAKWKLFSELLAKSSKKTRTAVINIDDETGRRWAKEISLPAITVSLTDKRADIHLLNYAFTPKGISATASVLGETVDFQSRLIGRHNLCNLLLTFGIGKAFSISSEDIAASLRRTSVIPGRLESVENRAGIHVFVDFAHTDDALKHVVDALRPIRSKRLLVVFGCGGDRDAEKRPRMGKVVGEAADVMIATSDNPRSEDPGSIIDDILQGVPNGMKKVSTLDHASESHAVCMKILDRRQAIESALKLAGAGDIVLIAGKGHETYQEIKGIRHPFDDRAVVRQWFSRRKG